MDVIVIQMMNMLQLEGILYQYLKNLHAIIFSRINLYLISLANGDYEDCLP